MADMAGRGMGEMGVRGQEGGHLRGGTPVRPKAQVAEDGRSQYISSPSTLSTYIDKAEDHRPDMIELSTLDSVIPGNHATIRGSRSAQALLSLIDKSSKLSR